MIKKYVRGNASNPEGVIKALEELGGINKYYYKGSDPDYVYFINTNKYIEIATNGSSISDIILDCFEEIQPVESTLKVFTNLDVTRWYFKMTHDGHAVQFADLHDNILSFPQIYKNDDTETGIVKVRIDFGKWIPIEEAGII